MANLANEAGGRFLPGKAKEAKAVFTTDVMTNKAECAISRPVAHSRLARRTMPGD